MHNLLPSGVTVEVPITIPNNLATTDLECLLFKLKSSHRLLNFHYAWELLSVMLHRVRGRPKYPERSIGIVTFDLLSLAKGLS
jgi:hypothetical protein